MVAKTEHPPNDSFCRYIYGGVSPRVNGKLVLQANFVSMGSAYRIPTGHPLEHWIGCDFAPFMSGMPDQAADAYNVAYNRFYDKVSSKGPELLVDLHERKQTEDMLVNRCQKLVRIAKAVKKRDYDALCREIGRSRRLKGLLRETKEYADIWMEIRYGWMPLVYTISDTAKKLGEPPRTRVRWVRGSGRVPVSVGYPSNYNPGGPPYPGGTYTGFLGSVRVTISGEVEIVNDNLVTLQEWNVANPLSTIWEATPFSWVIDWFVNVGECLGSLTANLGLSFKNTSITYSLGGTGWMIREADWFQYWGPCDMWSITRKERNVVPLPPGPKLRFNPKLNVKRAVDAVALVVQSLNSLRR